MQPITAVRVDGVAIELARVLADVETVHGRAGVYDGPTASTCRLVVVPSTRTDARRIIVGAELELDRAGGAALFRGRITDAAIVDDDPDLDPRLGVVAIGRVAELGGIPIGAGAYPAEAWGARVARALGEAGVASFVVQAPTPDLELANRDADPVDALAYLGELAEVAGAAVFDEPDGTIVVQALAARTGAGAGELDPELVRWSPEWEQHVDVVNEVGVEYGMGAPSTLVLDDPASIERYGLRHVDVAGTLRDASSADLRGRQLLARRGWTRWSVGALELLAPDFALDVGDLVALVELPDSAPVTHAGAIVEAVSLRVLDGDATMVLVLSDPVDSGLALPWEDVEPATLRWQDVAASCRWVDAYANDNLTGGA